MLAGLSSLTDGQARAPALGAAVAAGAAAALGQAPFDLWPLALIGFCLLFLLVLPVRGAAGAARLLWFGGAGYFAVALVWIIQPFMVDFARHGWMAPFALGLISFGLALFWAGAGFAAARLGQGRSGRAIALVIAMGLAELARSYVLTGFPWALIGHLWIPTPVMQLSALGGPHLLTLLALVVTIAPAAFGRRGVAAALVIVAGAWAAGQWRLSAPVPAPDDPVVVRLVQPNAAQKLKWRPDMIPVFLQRQLDLTSEPGDLEPDVIIWPETAVAYSLAGAGPVLEAIASAAAGKPVVLGIQRRDGEGIFNSAIVLDGNGRPAQIYDKHHLVPFGEFMPLAKLFARFGVFGLAAGKTYGYTPGPGPRLLELGPFGKALPLICYEAVFPQDLRVAGDRPDWLMQITNDAWFGTFSGPYQHLAQARLRAVEQGLPLVRAANTGVSAVIDGRGRVTASLPLNSSGQLTAPLPPALPETLYAGTGDLPMAMFLVAGLATLIFRRSATRR